MITTERLICKWCPYTATRMRWTDGSFTPVNPFFLLRAHIQEAHPAEHARIEDYLRQEVIVQEGG